MVPAADVRGAYLSCPPVAIRASPTPWPSVTLCRHAQSRSAVDAKMTLSHFLSFAQDLKVVTHGELQNLQPPAYAQQPDRCRFLIQRYATSCVYGCPRRRIRRGWFAGPLLPARDSRDTLSHPAPGLSSLPQPRTGRPSVLQVIEWRTQQTYHAQQTCHAQ